VGVLDFAAGAVASIITSFDVWHSTLPWLEIYGSEGTMLVPDPNNFSGSIKIRRGGDSEWREMPLSHSFADNSRGLGVLDMAVAIHENRPHRASGQLAYHVLDIMHAIHDASREGRHMQLTSGIERPAPLPMGMDNKGF
jgi:predicted dehydrogenase